MSKMTDKEIAKGLEYCADLYDCTDCPCKEFCGDLGMLQQNALGLINRQQAEIERLSEALEIHKGIAEDWKYEAKKLKEMVGETDV